MPIFEYRCLNCNEKHEQLVFPNFTDLKCPHCASTALEKLISLPSPPQFNGTGFYQTDYKKKSPPSDK